MNMGFINTMTSNLVAVYFHERKIRLPGAALRNNIPEIVSLTTKCLVDTIPNIRDAAEKLRDVLVKEGVSMTAPVAVAAPVAAPTPAPAPNAAIPPAPVAAPAALSPGVARAIAAQWQAVESLALDEAGPMGSMVIKKLQAQYPNQAPQSIRSILEAKLGPEVCGAIFSRIR